MKTIGILELWKKNEDDLITEDYNAELVQIFNADSQVSKIQSHVDAIQKIAKDRGFGEVRELSDSFVKKFSSDETDGAIYKLDEEYNEVRKDLHKIYVEIKTMVSACDTYEQEIGVLKAYGIVDENGVLVKEQWDIS